MPCEAVVMSLPSDFAPTQMLWISGSNAKNNMECHRKNSCDSFDLCDVHHFARCPSYPLSKSSNFMRLGVVSLVSFTSKS